MNVKKEEQNKKKPEGKKVATEISCRSEIIDVTVPEYKTNVNLKHLLQSTSYSSLVSGGISTVSAGLSAGSFYIPWYLTMLRLIAGIVSFFFGANEVLRGNNNQKVLLDAVQKYKDNLELVKNNDLMINIRKFCIGYSVLEEKCPILPNNIASMIGLYFFSKGNESAEYRRCITEGQEWENKLSDDELKDWQDVITASMISKYYNSNKKEEENNSNKKEEENNTINEIKGSLFDGIDDKGIQNICLGLTSLEFALYQGTNIEAVSNKLTRDIEGYHSKIIGSKYYAAARAVSLATNVGTAVASMALNMTNIGDKDILMQDAQYTTVSSKEKAISESEINTETIYQVEGTNEYYYRGIPVSKDSNGFWTYDKNYSGSINNPIQYSGNGSVTLDDILKFSKQNKNKLIKYTDKDGVTKYYYNGAEVQKGADGNYYEIINTSADITGNITMYDESGNLITSTVVLTPTTGFVDGSTINTNAYPFTSEYAGTMYYDPNAGILTQVSGNRYTYTINGTTYEVIRGPNGILYSLDGKMLSVSYKMYPSGKVTEETVASAQIASSSNTSKVFVDKETGKKYYKGQEVSGSVDKGYTKVLKQTAENSEKKTDEEAIAASKENPSIVYIVGTKKYMNGREVIGDASGGYTYASIVIQNESGSNIITVDSDGLAKSQLSENAGKVITDKATGKSYYRGYEVIRYDDGSFHYRDQVVIDRPSNPKGIVSGYDITVNGVKYVLGVGGKYVNSDSKELDQKVADAIIENLVGDRGEPISDPIIPLEIEVELTGGDGVKFTVIAAIDENGKITFKDKDGNEYTQVSDGSYKNSKTGKIIQSSNANKIKNSLLGTSSSNTGNDATIVYAPILLPDGKALEVTDDASFRTALNNILDQRYSYGEKITFKDQLTNLLKSKYFQSLSEDKKRELLNSVFDKRLFTSDATTDIIDCIKPYISSTTTDGDVSKSNVQGIGVPNTGGVNKTNLYKIIVKTAPSQASSQVISTSTFSERSVEVSQGSTTETSAAVYETKKGYDPVTNARTYLDPMAAVTGLYALKGSYAQTDVTATKEKDKKVEDKRGINVRTSGLFAKTEIRTRDNKDKGRV